jgi:hypothetical protein
MKSKAYIILGLGIFLLLGYTYAENGTESGDMTVSFLNETSVEHVTTTTTTSTGTTTTSVKAATTTTTTKATSTTKGAKPTNAAKPKTTTTVKKKTCNSYCKNIGYEGGDCRMNGLECRIRDEVKSVYGGRLCPTARLDTCCCQTEDSVEMDAKYSYTLREPIEPLAERSTRSTVKETAKLESVPTTKNESLASLKAYLDDDGEYEIVEG